MAVMEEGADDMEKRVQFVEESYLGANYSPNTLQDILKWEEEQRKLKAEEGGDNE